MNDNRASGQAAIEPSDEVRAPIFAFDDRYVVLRTRLFWD
jgi:hypothetical protein